MSEISYKSLRYKWIYRKPECSDISELADELGMPVCITEALYKRELFNADVLDAYFKTPLKGISSPFLIKDMEKAAAAIAESIKNNTKICIYGDYDVDGVTSVALMFLFLKEVGADVTYYIPNRLQEGYGLNKTAIKDIAEAGSRLIITVDCGINAMEEVQYAVSMGVEVIITDHHQPSESIPEGAAAVVNPMREDDTSAFKGLSGVGVAFKLVMALRYKLNESGRFKGKIPNIKKYLDLVTLGTIADVVPLVGENRIIVRHGLEILSGKNCRPGLRELKRVAGIDGQKVTTTHVGFGLAPRINAVGRMGASDKGLRLLITNDREQSLYLAEELDKENKSRQDIERHIIEESFKRVEKNKLHEKYKGLVLYSEEWHQGVIGIVASRLVEKYNLPAIVLTFEDGVGKGSGRSIPSFDLYKGLEQMQDILLSFGGHKYAAGLRIEEQHITSLQKRFHKAVEDLLEPKDFVAELKIDALMEPSDVSSELMKWLGRMEPYGAGNREPVFCMRGVNKHQEPVFVGRESMHLKIFLEKNGKVFDCIGYNMKAYKDVVYGNESFDIVFSPAATGYYHGRYTQLVLKDIKPADGEWETEKE
ncbi:single-stranded-DNA-specific exonuclease RecJ [Denitrovibrio acetiphilus DSM 12809]|uniref:Single-stranded-DNA-specific exonuclease RecJ n=1 Tax=Denitrovibrio acetiphilus (strain DSM 12809 / NBRC 114555 / N2460) TaxID=522772 RepID=D4H407_DENA2|nr:single-stranded-DNA-specific exonuclease RecJ [Denitrovibrio acetiphilus]ADD67318.1 single-stranded-DNA-specific exonuclease RecJ [Denitrovibrio acetiphilus DSM 12809]